MKKIIIIIVLVMMTAVNGFALTRGDIDGDGAVNVSDVTALVNRILGTASYADGVCDVDGNGAVNVSDVTSLVNIILSDNGSVTKSYTAGGVTFEMVSVDGGTFTMGATSEQGSDYKSDELPTHQVTLSSFSIGKTEVTQALWKAVMGNNPSAFKVDNLPVENVSWNDCQEFISKLNAMTGQTFRLPTEAEWEYAARGGNKSRGYKYSGSNTIGDVAWYDGNSGNKTHPVGTKAPNELGIYDMSGNVWEWCNDWYDSYSSSAQTNPKGPSNATYRVFRGGDWEAGAKYCRVSRRFSRTPGSRDYTRGLRLALSE